MSSTKKSPTPCCWDCGSTKVSVVFVGYEPTYYKAGQQPEGSDGRGPDVAQHDLTCQSCGNVWRDGSGDFADRAEGPVRALHAAVVSGSGSR